MNHTSFLFSFRDSISIPQTGSLYMLRPWHLISTVWTWKVRNLWKLCPDLAERPYRLGNRVDSSARTDFRC
uniref:Uncharacterized protein n=1 Tax=Anopheles dirus TaxID=7168 RepID=A0A182NX42_9DIPT